MTIHVVKQAGGVTGADLADALDLVVSKAELGDVIADDSTIAATVSAGVSSAVGSLNLLVGNDARVPRIVNSNRWLAGWVDKAHRGLAGVRQTDGRLEVPLGVEAPHVGIKVASASNPYSFARFDPTTFKVSEDCLTHGGVRPLWTIRNQRARLRAGSTKLQPLAVTLPGGSAAVPFVDTSTSVHARYAIQRLARKTYSVRVHIANTNDRNGTNYGAVSVSGVYLGAAARGSDGELNGNFASTPTQIAASASIPSNGTDWVSASFPLDIGSASDWLLSIGYTSAAQNNHNGPAPCWRSNSPGDVAQLTPTNALTQSKYGPLKIWLEVEIDGDTSVIAVLGDSLSVGTENARPVYDSPASKIAFAHGAFPVHYAHHGSTLQEWMAGTGTKWTQWASYPKPDAVIVALGSNSVFNGDSLATMQANLQTTLATVRSKLSPAIYLATIMPRVGSTAETVRNAYNAQLLGIPYGVLNTFDFSSSVTDPANAAQLNPAFNSGDNTHLTTGGSAANARTVCAPLGAAARL